YDSASPPNGVLRLPPLVRDVQIDYTALSLAAPEKVRFRYKLEGWDREWQDVGNRRQVFYSNLPPRDYRFRVTACNNSGGWNEAGASLDFSIAPAYYQTAWFRLSCVAAILVLLAGFYQLRLRPVNHQLNLRMEARIAERTRIARDLHDTLLQSFQAVLMKISAATYLVSHRPAEAQEKLESVIEQAERAISEGREAIQGLRCATPISSDLGEAIGTLGEDLADQAGRNRPKFCVNVEGRVTELPPLVRDEVYHIACEALRNSF